MGRFERHGALGIVVPTDPRLRHDVFVRVAIRGVPKDGDIVVADIVAYPSRNHAAQGVVDEVLGQEGEPGLEIEIIIREHGLRTEFPAEVEEQAVARVDAGDRAELEQGREDLRDLFTVTIDPVDAKRLRRRDQHRARGRPRSSSACTSPT